MHPDNKQGINGVQKLQEFNTGIDRVTIFIGFHLTKQYIEVNNAENHNSQVSTSKAMAIQVDSVDNNKDLIKKPSPSFPFKLSQTKIKVCPCPWSEFTSHTSGMDTL